MNKQKAIYALCCLLTISGITGTLRAQNKLKLTDFHFGYYHQKTVGQPLDYRAFTEGSDLRQILPDPINYKNGLEQTVLNQSGLGFGFTFNLINGESQESLPHFFTLGIRNGFLRSNLDLEASNELFVLETQALNSINYSFRLKAEGFGLSGGYNFRILNTNRVNAFLGATFLYEVPVSQKLNVVPDYKVGSPDTAFSTINNTYFLEKTASLFFMPQASLDVRPTKHTVLSFQYQFGLARQKFESTVLQSRARNISISLKFLI